MELAKELMTEKILTMKPIDSIIDAHLLMKDKDIRHIPIMDNDNKLVGIISDRDVQKAMVIKKINEFNNEIVIPAEYKIENFMSWPVYTVGEKTHLKLVAEILLKEKISSLIVQNDQGQITGIVTTTDLLAYMVQIIDNIDKPNRWTLTYYLSR